MKMTAALCLLQACFLLTGCGSNRVSPRATEYAQAIYTASNLQKESNLQPLRQKILLDRNEGALASHEADRLFQILDNAEAGEWVQAMQASRRLIEKQIRH